MATKALTWAELSQFATPEPDRVNGPTSSQATLRLFGQREDQVRVILYRDNHAWCPYCQKIWMYLEEKQIPYRIAKVTMFCYGEKEAWYKKIVPSGMLPALSIDGKLITESDEIMWGLEQTFGPLVEGMEGSNVFPLRRLERLLFRAWCDWLCRPHNNSSDASARKQFVAVAQQVGKALDAKGGPYFLGTQLTTADCVFIPYVERMAASLYYYKGYDLKKDVPQIGRWFAALETRSTYIGTQSDYHTHCHDLPPQMGGCYTNNTPEAQSAARHVDEGPYNTIPDCAHDPRSNLAGEVVARVQKHIQNILKANPDGDKDKVDAAIRAALTQVVTGGPCAPPAGSDAALRYIRDRVNVPRDMSIHAGKVFRQALEDSAAMVGKKGGPQIPTRHRRDQDPLAFRL